MEPDYKSELNKLLQKKKKGFPTSFSDSGLANILSVLDETPNHLVSIAKRFDEESSLEPILEGKRSMRETLIHLLNVEGLNYMTIYPAFLLNKPNVYPLHAERDFDRLSLFRDFKFNQLLEAFCCERRKTLNFMRSLERNDWLKQLIESGKARMESIYWRARGLAIHDFTHIQILKLQMDI